MLESVGVVGALTALGVIVGRVLILVIALRGTTPAERPAIIDALANFVRVTHKSSRPGRQPVSDGRDTVRDQKRLVSGKGPRSG
jgi:hypothetical protein